MDLQHFGEAIVGGLVVVKQVVDVVGGRAKDRRHGESMMGLRGDIAKQFADLKLELKLDLQAVRGLVVGSDGQNGVRGDVRKLEERVDDIEQRERAAPHHVGALERPRR